MSTSLPSLATVSAIPLAPAAPAPERARLAEAARQFEAIFVRQMLAAARKADFGGEGILGGREMDTFRQMQDDRFAEIAAQRGSFGLAKMIEARLAGQLSDSPPRLREGLGEGLFSNLAQQALPRPLPQAGGENAASNSSSGGA